MQSAGTNFISLLTQGGLKLPAGKATDCSYHEKHIPETNTADEVGDKLTPQYQHMIGICDGW